MNGGYELSLVMMMIGPIVGLAVRWASAGRGGGAYQAVAIALTYLAIVSTYTPATHATLNVNRGQASQASVMGAPRAIEAGTGNANEQSLARFAATVAIVSLTVCAAPSLVGAQNAIGLAILAVGLYPAWRMNRRATA